MQRNNKLVLGFAHWGQSDVAIEEMIATVKYAAEQGITEIDVAPHYGNGMQENILGVALLALPEEIRSNIKISTKAGRIIDPDNAAESSNGFTKSSGFAQVFDYTSSGIKLSFAQSQLRLIKQSVHALYLHDIDAETHKEQFAIHYGNFVDDGYKAFDELKSARKITVSGIGSNDVDVCLKLIKDGRFNIDRIMIAGCYNLLNFSALAELFPLCKERNIEIYNAAPYGGGFLSGQKGNSFFRYQHANEELINRVNKIEKICKQYGVSLPHAAIQFAQMHPQVAKVVVGARTRKELEATLHYANTPINPKFWDALKNEDLIPVTTEVSIYAIQNINHMILNERMLIIDSHIHLWDNHKLNYPWLNSIPKLNKAFLPNELCEDTRALRMESFVFVQADCNIKQSLEEVAWVTQLAKKDIRISGIVAHAPLEIGEEVRKRLSILAMNPLVKGVRRLLQSEADDFCLQENFIRGVQLLAEFDLSFDICIKASQLPVVIKLIQKCPKVTFILDHLGKPNVAQNQLEPWQSHLEELAKLPNVYCKVSGLITEANHEIWSIEDIKPYVLHAITVFGIDRVIFGSDWPVVDMAGTYIKWVNALTTILHSFSENDLHKLFYENSRAIYRLDNIVQKSLTNMLFTPPATHSSMNTSFGKDEIQSFRQC